MLKNIKNYAMALGALAIAATSGTLMSFSKKDIVKQDKVTLYFEGDPTKEAQVKDPNNWAEDNPAQSCSGSFKACSMDVNPSDVQGAAGSRTLNTTKIILGANSTTSGYTPYKAGGSSLNNITPHNKD